METKHKTPGWRLRRWRMLHAMTQTAAAKLFGISQPSLSQYELGQLVPPQGVKDTIRAKTGVRWP